MALKAYNKIETLALELSAETAREQNVHVVDVTYRKEDGKNVLCFYIDKEGGIGIDECEVFSKAVESVLDEKDLHRVSTESLQEKENLFTIPDVRLM